MRTVLKVPALTGAVLLVAAVVHGQPQTQTSAPAAARFVDVVSGLSLSDAIAQALEREPLLRAAHTELVAARGMRMQAGLRPNPTVSLEQREQQDGTDRQTMASIEWPLDLFRRGARIAAADRETEAVEQSVADRERLLAGDVRMQYGEAAAAVRELEIAGNLAASQERDLELRRARVESGASPPLERDLLEVELRRLQADQLLAAGRAEAAMFDLKRLLGLAPEAALRLRDTLEMLAADSASGAAPTGERPDVREAEIRVRLAEARIARSRTEGRFDVNLFGSYARMTSGFPQRGFDAQGVLVPVQGTFHYLAGGAMITLPVLNRNQGEVAAAQAERAGASARLEAARLEAQAEMAAASSRDRLAREALVRLQDGVRLARQNLEVTRQTYELGRGTVSEVLAEQRRYLDVERAYTATLLAAYQARTALQRARGEQP